MVIKYLADVDTPKISITAPQVTDFLDSPDDYTGISIVASLTCPVTPITQFYDVEDLELTTSKFYVAEVDGIDTLFINPSLFSGTTFVDGIYKFAVKFVKVDGSSILITNCIFIDITMSCKVASTMASILEEATLVTNEKTATIIHLLHYALVNGSNCGCNCDDMCTVFNGLKNLLLDLDPQILNDCGC